MKHKKKCCFRDHFGFFLLSFLVFLLGGVMFRGLGVALDKGESLLPHMGGFLGLLFLEGVFVYFVYFRSALEEKKKLSLLKREESAIRDHQDVLIAFRKASTLAEKTSLLAKLEALGTKSLLHRQECLEILGREQEWMRGCEDYLKKSDLQQWRITGQPLDSDLTVSLERQAFSRACLRIIETLIRSHVSGFKPRDGMLALSFKVLPALRLGGLDFPEGSISFENGLYWQSDFSQSSFGAISFQFSDLTGCRFLYAKLEGVNFNQALVSRCVFKTDLSLMQGFLVSQFFSLEDWFINLLSPEQEGAFFPIKDSTNARWVTWTDKDYLRAGLVQQYDKIWSKMVK